MTGEMEKKANGRKLDWARGRENAATTYNITFSHKKYFVLIVANEGDPFSLQEGFFVLC